MTSPLRGGGDLWGTDGHLHAETDSGLTKWARSCKSRWVAIETVCCEGLTSPFFPSGLIFHLVLVLSYALTGSSSIWIPSPVFTLAEGKYGRPLPAHLYHNLETTHNIPIPQPPTLPSHYSWKDERVHESLVKINILAKPAKWQKGFNRDYHLHTSET